MAKKKTQIDLRKIELRDGDLLTIVSLEDKPGIAVVVAERIEDGVSKRRLIEFPEDPLLLSRLAQNLMRIADIQRISFNKKRGDAYVEFGPKSAREVYDRTK